jgi:hypothetical protein
MTGPSDDLNDLESDIRHVSTLLSATYDIAIQTPMPEAMQTVQDLLWIARDLAEKLVATAEACHQKVLDERKAARKAA